MAAWFSCLGSCTRSSRIAPEPDISTAKWRTEWLKDPAPIVSAVDDVLKQVPVLPEVVRKIVEYLEAWDNVFGPLDWANCFGKIGTNWELPQGIDREWQEAQIRLKQRVIIIYYPAKICSLQLAKGTKLSTLEALAEAPRRARSKVLTPGVLAKLYRSKFQPSQKPETNWDPSTGNRCSIQQDTWFMMTEDVLEASRPYVPSGFFSDSPQFWGQTLNHIPQELRSTSGKLPANGWDILPIEVIITAVLAMALKKKLWILPFRGREEREPVECWMLPSRGGRERKPVYTYCVGQNQEIVVIGGFSSASLTPFPQPAGVFTSGNTEIIAGLIPGKQLKAPQHQVPQIPTDVKIAK